MPNIQGDYTLSELALKIEVSPSWINKVQKKTGIGGKVGTSGKRVYFNEDEVTIFKNVKLLRLLDFGLKEIKEIFELEGKIVDLAGVYIKRHPDAGEEEHMFIIHPGGMDTLSDLMSQDAMEGKKFDSSQYEKCLRLLFKISKEITKRATLLGQDLEKFKKKLAYNSLDWAKIN